MRSKSCNGDGLAMHNRFQGGQPSKLLIFLSLLSKICDFQQLPLSLLFNRCDVLSFKRRSHRRLRNAQIRVFTIPEVRILRKNFDAPWSHPWASTRYLWAGKAIRYTCIAVFLASEGTGLAHVPCFNSIGKLTTRSDFHRAVDLPYNSASRGHGIWHEGALAHGRSWIPVQIPEDYFKSG